MEKVLESFKITEYRPVATPLDQFPSEQDLADAPFDFPAYRQAIGSIMYLMVCTRPKLTFLARKLLHFLEKPTLALWEYLNGCFDI